MNLRSYLGAVFLAFAVVAPAHAADLASCIAGEAQRMEFSGVISVFKDGKPVSDLAMGRIGGPDSPAITPATRFNIGSAGKMFTAAAIGQLVDAGKVVFTDPVGQKLPVLSPEVGAVTIHQLLTHTSGLGDYFSPQNLGAIQAAKWATDLLPLIAADKPQFPPGTQFRYSNSGFALLGMVIEAVSGENYGDYIREHIFKPAGMTSTSLDAGSPETLAAGMTRLPVPTPGSPPVLLQPGMRPPADGPLRSAPGAAVRGSPSGGAFSTAGDLQRFMTAMRGEGLTKSAQVLTSGKVEAGPGLKYAYGFGATEIAGRQWFGHNGGTPGANAEVIATQDGTWSIVVLANRDPPMATQMLRYIQQGLTKPPCY